MNNSDFNDLHLLCGQDEVRYQIERALLSNSENNTQDILEKLELPFDVLGYSLDRKILIWHKGYLMRFPINQLRLDELRLLLGPPSENEDRAKQIKNVVIDKAYEKGVIDEEEPIRTGIWRLQDEWLIVSGKLSFTLQDGAILHLEGPQFNSRIICFEKNSWIDQSLLSSAIEKNKGTSDQPLEFLRQTFQKLKTHIKQWSWSEKDMADYVTALVMISPFQFLMRWRPWIYISGATGTGKSAFFEHILEMLYRNLIKRVDKATAHSIAQAIGNTSKIVILDEFEKNKHISGVLELLKLMNRGGNKTSGTPGQSELSFTMHHIPWMASIYLPKTLAIDEAQRNRIINLNLQKEKFRKPLDLMSEPEAVRLVADIIASIILSWDLLEKESKRLESKTQKIIESFDGQIDARAVQNFMYLSALLNLVSNSQDYTVPTWAQREMKDDGSTLLEAIIYSNIRYEGDEYLVSDLIDIAVDEPLEIPITKKGALQALRLYGLSVVNRGTWYLAIDPIQLRRKLFKFNEDFKDLDISGPLERLTGAVKRKTSWGSGSGSKPTCIQVPIEHIIHKDKEDDGNLRNC